MVKSIQVSIEEYRATSKEVLALQFNLHIVIEIAGL